MRQRPTRTLRPFPPGALDRTRDPWLWRGCAALLLAGLTLAVFAPVRRFAFVTYDDAWFVTENAAVAGGLTWEHLQWGVQHSYLGAGGPLTWISHMIDIELFGLDAGGHHLTSLMWHLANTVLLFGLLTRMTKRLAASALVAALFAVHPLHVESVAWIAQRKDVLSTFFWLCATWAYVAYTTRPRVGAYLAVVALHIGGLLSKPMVATLPFTFLLLDVWPLGRWQPGDGAWASWRRLIVEKLPLMALSVLSLWAALRSQEQLGAIARFDVVPLGVRMSNAVVSYVAYLKLFLWPSGLVPHYPYDAALSTRLVVACLVCLLCLTLAALALVRRVPAVPVGWAWYLGTLVPTLGIVQVGGHRMADRFTYVPSIGLFLSVVWGAAALAARWRVPLMVKAAAAIVIVATLAVTARAQVWTWRDGIALWQHAVSVSPDNARAQANLGASLAIAGRYREAVAAYHAALRSGPAEPKVHRNLGLALGKLGDHDGALAELRVAVSLDPGYAAGHSSLADALAQRGETVSAIDHYREAIRLDPRVGLPQMNLAITLAAGGRLEEALPYARDAVGIDPRRAEWRFTLALILIDLGRREDAARELQQVLALAPGHQGAIRELAALR